MTTKVDDRLDEKSLRRILIDVAREREERGPAKPQDYFHPSAMGQCERRVILSHFGVEGLPMSDDDALFFWIGNIIHEAVQKGVSKRMGGTVWNEVRFRDETYKISGRLDTLRLTQEDEVWSVWEYKTVRTDAFRFNLPKPDAILQVLIYTIFPLDCPECLGYEVMKPKCDVCTNVGLVGPADFGKLAYIGKEDGRLEVYDIQPDEALKAAVKQKLMRLQMLADDYGKRGVLPDKLPKEHLTDKKGVPQFYVKSSTKFGFKAGDPKLKDDWRVQNCPYLGSGQCCGDKETK